MKNKRILIVAAHPDDEVLGCGGTVDKLTASGYDFGVVFVCEGSSGRYVSPQSEGVAADINAREIASHESAGILGIKHVVHLKHDNLRLSQTSMLNVVKSIENQIDVFKPSVVLTHADCDINEDHSIVSKAVATALRPVGERNNISLLQFEVGSSTNWGTSLGSGVFEPNFFVALSGTHVQKKWDALEKYQSELVSFPHPRSLEGISVFARYRGMQIGVEFAEAFRLVRGILR